jgi:miniconductance mechanosensitive channel
MNFKILIERQLLAWHVPDTLVLHLSWLAVIVCVLLVCLITNFIAKRYFLRILKFVGSKSKANWYEALSSQRVFARLSHVAPAIVIFFFAPYFKPYDATIQKLAIVYMMFTGVWVLSSFLNALSELYTHFSVAQKRPIKGYIQVVKIIVYLFGLIFIVSHIIDRSPWGLVSGLGALTAILLVVFKDSIQGFVSSVQVAANDLVHIGDWIEMPGRGVNGDVIDLSLHMMKVQNFDKSIVSVPLHLLTSETVQNWRGMKEAGVRRVMRSIPIDASSVTQDNLTRFRKYATEYLVKHERVHQDHMLTVRLLDITHQGVPLQIYAFVDEMDWAKYEAIVAEMMEHLLAALPRFELKVLQYDR